MKMEAKQTLEMCTAVSQVDWCISQSALLVHFNRLLRNFGEFYSSTLKMKAMLAFKGLHGVVSRTYDSS
jgi:hypothetical protein